MEYAAHIGHVGVRLHLELHGFHERRNRTGADEPNLPRGLAGASFGLYLLHYPLLNFVGTVVPGPPDGALHRVLVFGLALGGALGLAGLIEPRKATLKRHLRSALHWLRGQPAPQPAAQQRLS